MSNDGHVTDVGRPVHETPDLFDSEAIENIVSKAILLSPKLSK